MSAVAPDGAEPRPDTRLLLRLLAENSWRQRRRLAAVALLAALPLAALALAMAPRFVSTSTVILNLGPEYAAHATAGSAVTPNLAFDSDHILGNESTILDGEDLHRAVIRAVGIGRLYPDLLHPPGIVARAAGTVLGLPDALAHLLGGGATRPPGGADTDALERALAIFDAHFDAEPSKLASVITLRFTHRDPRVARDTLAVLERLYLADRRMLYDPQSTVPLGEQVAAARAALDDAERRLAGYRSAHALPDYTTQLDIVLHEQGDLAHDRTDAGRAGATARARIDKLGAELRAAPAMVAGGSDSDLDGRTATLRTSLDGLRARAATVLDEFRPDSPEAAALADQIARSRAALAAGGAGGAPLSSTHTVRNATRDGVLADLLAAETDLGAAAARADADDRALASIAARIATLDAGERRLDALTASRDALLDAFRNVSSAYAEEAKDEAVAARSRPGARIAALPNLPTRPKPLRLVLLAASCVFALFAAAAAALGLHAGRRVLLDAAEIERAGIAVLGRIPRGDPFAALAPIRPVLA